MKIQTEKVTLESAGTVDASLATLFYLPQIANASLPAAATCEGAVAYDTTNNKIVFSNGTAWETVTSA